MSVELIEAALGDLAVLRQKLEFLLREAKAVAGKQRKVQFKQPNGRLSEAGVQKLREMVDAGVPDSQIARFFDITQPAVIHQRQKYQASDC